MGFWSSIIWREVDDEPENTGREAASDLPELYNGMTLDLETADGVHILTGRLTGYAPGDTALSLERLPGGLSFHIRDVGTSVLVRGVTESMTQFFLKGVIQESTRLICRLKDVKVKTITEMRRDFRLRMGIPVTMFYQTDTTYSHPEECTLVDISTGGACIESEYLHAEDEESTRVVEYQPGKFRYGFLFAQLKESELTELTRTLYNIQVGNRSTWVRTEDGHW